MRILSVETELTIAKEIEMGFKKAIYQLFAKMQIVPSSVGI